MLKFKQELLDKIHSNTYTENEYLSHAHLDTLSNSLLHKIKHGKDIGQENYKKILSYGN